MLLVLALVAGAGAFAACCIVPWRMATGPGGGFLTFTYVPDEMTYAHSIQPLPVGSTPTNIYNGIGDPNVISPLYLEDFCRLVLSVTGMESPEFFWAWRILFPLVLMLALGAVAAASFTRQRPWTKSLSITAMVLSLPLFYCAFGLVSDGPPLHKWLDRIPTNVEYPLSALVAAFLIRYLDRPTEKTGVALTLTALALLYLRPYAAFPWAMALVVTAITVLVMNRVTFRQALPALLTLAIGVAPWVAIDRWNAGSSDFREMLTRYFLLPYPYEIHARWLLFLVLASVMGYSARWLPPERRLFAIASAAGMALLPFVCGLPTLASQMLLGDRYTPFYLVALLAIAFMIIDARSRSWRGRAGAQTALACSSVLLVLCWICGGILAMRNLQHDFQRFSNDPYVLALEDQKMVPAYRWVKANSAPNALVLVDDGVDWSRAPDDPQELLKFAMERCLASQDDLFQVIARRRRLYHTRLGAGGVMSYSQLMDLARVHRGTLGMRYDPRVYALALKRFPPDYVLWRKGPAPIPRGFGNELQNVAQVVFEDDAALVWKMNYPEGFIGQPAPVP